MNMDIDELHALIKNRQKIHEKITDIQMNRTTLLAQLREIFDDAAAFLPSPYKFNCEGYYIWLTFNKPEDGMEKCITVQKKWEKKDLMTIADDEFTTIIKIIQDEMTNKYTEQVAKNREILTKMQ